VAADRDRHVCQNVSSSFSQSSYKDDCIVNTSFHTFILCQQPDPGPHRIRLRHRTRADKFRVQARSPCRPAATHRCSAMDPRHHGDPMSVFARLRNPLFTQGAASASSTAPGGRMHRRPGRPAPAAALWPNRPAATGRMRHTHHTPTRPPGAGQPWAGSNRCLRG
jgi:hypothetical protein